MKYIILSNKIIISLNKSGNLNAYIIYACTYTIFLTYIYLVNVVTYNGQLMLLDS